MKKHISVFVAVFILGLILGTLGTVSFPVGSNITYFWPAAALQTISGIFFGFWGVLAGVTFPIVTNFWTDGTFGHTVGFIPSSLLQCAIPAIVTRKYASILDFTKMRYIALFIIACAIAPHVLGSLAGCGILYGIGNIKDSAEFWSLVITWIIGNVPSAVIFGFLLVKTLLPILKDNGLYYEGYMQ